MGLQSSPRCRSGKGQRCLTICHQRPSTPPCNPDAAPQDRGGWAASFHAWRGHRSCSLSPSPQCRWQSCRDAKHQSMCPATTLFVWPHHGVPCRLVAPLQKMMICWSHSGAVLLRAFWVPLSPDGLDFLTRVRLWVCVLMFAKDLINAGEGVFGKRALLPFFTIRCHLPITLGLNPALVFFGVVIFFSAISLSWEDSDLLLDTSPSSVAWE